MTRVLGTPRRPFSALYHRSRMRFALVSALLLVAGCSSGPLVRDAPDRSAPPGFPDHTAAGVAALIGDASAPLRYQSGARIEVRRGDQTDKAPLSLQASGDSVSAVVRGPFGIEVGRALATADSVFLYDALKGRVLLGPARAASRYVPGFDEPSGGALRGAMLGEAPPVTEWGAFTPAPAAGLNGGPAYVFSQRYDDGSLATWTVDAGLWRLVRYELHYGAETLLVQRFGAFDTVDGRVVPRRVTLERPPDDMAVEIEHRDLRIGGGASPSFRAPANAPRTRFD